MQKNFSYDQEIRQNADSTTASGIGKIVDAVESFMKSL